MWPDKMKKTELDKQFEKMFTDMGCTFVDSTNRDETIEEKKFNINKNRIKNITKEQIFDVLGMATHIRSIDDIFSIEQSNAIISVCNQVLIEARHGYLCVKLKNIDKNVL